MAVHPQLAVSAPVVAPVPVVALAPAVFTLPPVLQVVAPHQAAFIRHLLRQAARPLHLRALLRGRLLPVTVRREVRHPPPPRPPAATIASTEDAKRFKYLMRGGVPRYAVTDREAVGISLSPPLLFRPTLNTSQTKSHKCMGMQPCLEHAHAHAHALSLSIFVCEAEGCGYLFWLPTTTAAAATTTTTTSTTTIAIDE